MQLPVTSSVLKRAFPVRALCCATSWFFILAALVWFVDGAAVTNEAQKAENEPAQNVELRSNENKLRAIFLRQLALFGIWTESESNTSERDIVIVVVGSESSPDLFEQLVISCPADPHRPIVVKREMEPDKISDCEILFVSGTVKRESQCKIIKAHRGKPVLVVGETPEFASDGGCIGLLSDSGTITKEFNSAEIKKQRITIDLRLQRGGTFVETVRPKASSPATTLKKSL